MGKKSKTYGFVSVNVMSILMGAYDCEQLFGFVANIFVLRSLCLNDQVIVLFIVLISDAHKKKNASKHKEKLCLAIVVFRINKAKSEQNRRDEKRKAIIMSLFVMFGFSNL